MKKIFFLFFILSLFVSCNPVSEDKLNTARTQIESELKGKGIYERGNLPEDLDVDRLLNGYFDIVGGAYRYIVNEDRNGRADLPEIGSGDSISIRFDARIYASSFDGSTTFFTNIESRRSELAGSNAEFDPTFWTTDPLKLKVPEDGGILKSVQRALVGCRAVGDEGTVSDVVRIYLPPNVAFGATAVYNVKSGSTLVFEVTDIKIMEN